MRVWVYDYVNLLATVPNGVWREVSRGPRLLPEGSVRGTRSSWVRTSGPYVCSAGPVHTAPGSLRLHLAAVAPVCHISVGVCVPYDTLYTTLYKIQWYWDTLNKPDGRGHNSIVIYKLLLLWNQLNNTSKVAFVTRWYNVLLFINYYYYETSKAVTSHNPDAKKYWILHC